jgi:hypothetical protein
VALVIPALAALVIPAKAGTHFDLASVFSKQELSLACGERVTFGMTPGILPFAATRPASLFAPLLRRSAQK